MKEREYPTISHDLTLIESCRTRLPAISRGSPRPIQPRIATNTIVTMTPPPKPPTFLHPPTHPIRDFPSPESPHGGGVGPGGHFRMENEVKNRGKTAFLRVFGGFWGGGKSSKQCIFRDFPTQTLARLPHFLVFLGVPRQTPRNAPIPKGSKSRLFAAFLPSKTGVLATPPPTHRQGQNGMWDGVWGGFGWASAHYSSVGCGHIDLDARETRKPSTSEEPFTDCKGGGRLSILEQKESNKQELNKMSKRIKNKIRFN